MSANDSLPDDVETLKRLVRAGEADLARARAEASSAAALIAHLRLTIEKMRREIYGPRSERKARLLDQMELELEELEASAAEDDLAAEQAAASADDKTPVRAFRRKKPSRKPFPAHLPRERVIVSGPTACTCCGSSRLAKLGEDVTETLEVVPRQWKVVQYVREKFTCRACEGISQAPAPFYVLPRGFAGPSLLAMIVFEKYGQHQPLNRQAERYAREGVDLSLSTLADQVGGCAAVLRPIYDLIRAHVFSGSRIHGDDTPVPVLAKWQTATGRLWTYVRDDRPFGGRDPPAAVFFYSRDRGGDHPERHLNGYGLTNNAAERELRGIALGRKSWLFAGSDRGGERAAVMYTTIQTAKLNGIDPQTWLADVLARINDHKITDIAALLPWHWAAEMERRRLAA
jgi:transposase